MRTKVTETKRNDVSAPDPAKPADLTKKNFIGTRLETIVEEPAPVAEQPTPTTPRQENVVSENVVSELGSTQPSSNLAMAHQAVIELPGVQTKAEIPTPSSNFLDELGSIADQMGGIGEDEEDIPNHGSSSREEEAQQQGGGWWNHLIDLVAGPDYEEQIEAPTQAKEQKAATTENPSFWSNLVAAAEHMTDQMTGTEDNEVEEEVAAKQKPSIGVHTAKLSEERTKPKDITQQVL